MVLTESGKVHELNGDDSVTEEDEEEETTRQQSVVADVSLFDVSTLSFSTREINLYL